MAGVGRRRRFPHRQAWIRRRIWSKQRGVKLAYYSSSESDGKPDPVLKPVVHDVIPKHAVEVRDEGDGSSCGPNMGTCACDRSPKRVMEVGGCSNYGCGRDWIRKHAVAMEGSSDGTCTLNLGSCGHDRSPKHDVKMGRGIGRGRLRVDCEGHLYVLDSEAEDSAVEESCRPEFRREKEGKKCLP